MAWKTQLHWKKFSSEIHHSEWTEETTRCFALLAVITASGPSTLGTGSVNIWVSVGIFHSYFQATNNKQTLPRAPNFHQHGQQSKAGRGLKLGLFVQKPAVGVSEGNHKVSYWLTTWIFKYSSQDKEEHGAQAWKVQPVLQQVLQLPQLWQWGLDVPLLGGELQPPASYQGTPCDDSFSPWPDTTLGILGQWECVQPLPECGQYRQYVLSFYSQQATGSLSKGRDVNFEMQVQNSNKNQIVDS